MVALRCSPLSCRCMCGITIRFMGLEVFRYNQCTVFHSCCASGSIFRHTYTHSLFQCLRVFPPHQSTVCSLVRQGHNASTLRLSVYIGTSVLGHLSLMDEFDPDGSIIGWELLHKGNPALSLLLSFGCPLPPASYLCTNTALQ